MPLPPRVRGGTRRHYRDIVLGKAALRPSPPQPRTGSGTGRPPRVLAGTILDACPNLLVLEAADGEVRVPMTSATTVWRGGRGGPAALRPGREVIVRVDPGGPGADRVWVDIGRVTGTILACERNTVQVDMGPHRGRTSVVIPSHARGRILVRHPRLEPGYLIDVICIRSPDGPQAARPGTSQPGYLPADLASPRPDVPVPDVSHGTVTWFGGATYDPSPLQADDRSPRPFAPATRGATPSRSERPSPSYPGFPGSPGMTGPISPDAMSWPGLGTGSSRISPSHPVTSESKGPNDHNANANSSRSRPGPRHASPTRKSSIRKRATPPTLGDHDHARTAEARSPRTGAGPAYLLNGEHGAAYPFVDPEGDASVCPDTPPGCIALPYLSLGSELTLQNECAGVVATLPVIECGCVAARYCDRCVECGTSPRGRLAELTPAAFVALGGDLDAGCFNAVLRFDAALRDGTPRHTEG